MPPTSGGADIVVAHMGLTTSGTIGARTAKTLDQSVGEVAAIVEACKKVRPDVFVLCHGGPIAMPADAHYVLSRVAGHSLNHPTMPEAVRLEVPDWLLGRLAIEAKKAH